ncbi:sugar ABC transporter substrate-binding protein [Mahella sp.]|uniref:ABC transporter substrate-binding protein n=1 Tax=Mahella sp. TaxID=2798721 RepID=UPI0025BF0A00|nr:sugar ABC transporter substrate-binding protein [Mahella sp.]MBZ4664830.1 extracellular solute-binding protein family 1 [Mahella sp.]MDK2902338.1 pectin-derived oligosaccharide transport system substrate-binding protein [Clostridiales bacterium]
MKKMIAIILMAVMLMSVMLLSACGGGDTATEPEEKPESTGADDSKPAVDEGAPVEIRVAWWGDTKRHELYNQICDVFESKNPNIKLIREPVSWTDYWDKLTVQSASGGAPDFMGMHPQFASDYVRRGVLEPLDAYVKDGTIDLSNFSQAAIDSGTVNGINYMISMGLTTNTVLVNKSMLEDLGVQVPDFNWTWDDLKAIGSEARAALDAKGKKDSWLREDASGAYQIFRYWARQNGRDLYTADGNIAYTKEDAASWFAMWKDLRDSGIVPDSATTTEYAKATLEDSLIARGKTAMVSIPPNQYKLYSAALPEAELIMVRNPSKPDGKVGEFVEGAHFAISSKTTPEKKLAAAKLINFWVNDEDSIKLFRLDQGVPANTKMVEFLTPLLDEQDKAIVDYVSKTIEIATPTTFPPSGASEVDSLFQQIAEKVRFDQLTPEDAGAQLVSEAQAILDSNKK